MDTGQASPGLCTGTHGEESQIITCRSCNNSNNNITSVALKEALYRIWCGENRLGDSGVKVV